MGRVAEVGAICRRDIDTGKRGFREMTTQIQLQSTAVTKEIDVHIMPCHIAYNGPSNVSEFFRVRQDQETQTAVSSFRGRKLCGRRVQLPDNYTGTSTVSQK